MGRMAFAVVRSLQPLICCAHFDFAQEESEEARGGEGAPRGSPRGTPMSRPAPQPPPPSHRSSSEPDAPLCEAGRGKGLQQETARQGSSKARKERERQEGAAGQDSTHTRAVSLQESRPVWPQIFTVTLNQQSAGRGADDGRMCGQAVQGRDQRRDGSLLPPTRKSRLPPPGPGRS